MNKPEFKVFPCVFCTIGYNCYVAGHKVVSGTIDTLTGKAHQATPTAQDKVSHQGATTDHE